MRRTPSHRPNAPIEVAQNPVKPAELIIVVRADTPERIEEIRHVVREELANGQADARFTLGEARRRHAALKNEHAALMKAHYAGAVPLDILKSEMDRITREADAAEHQIASSEQALEQLDDQLERALEVARLCHEQYVNAIPAERRLLNQGLFTKLFIGQDGSVEDAEVQELFAGLLSKDSTLAVEAREMAVVPVPTQRDVAHSAAGTDGALVPVREWGNRPERRWSPSAVLLRLQSEDDGEYAQTPPKLSFGRGSNNAHLAEGVGFEPTGHFCPLVFKTRSIGRSDNPPGRASLPSRGSKHGACRLRRRSRPLSRRPMPFARIVHGGVGSTSLGAVTIPA